MRNLAKILYRKICKTSFEDKKGVSWLTGEK